MVRGCLGMPRAPVPCGSGFRGSGFRMPGGSAWGLARGWGRLSQWRSRLCPSRDGWPCPALVAQGIEHRSPKAGVGSSNLPGGTQPFPRSTAIFRLLSLLRFAACSPPGAPWASRDIALHDRPSSRATRRDNPAMASFATASDDSRDAARSPTASSLALFILRSMPPRRGPCGFGPNYCQTPSWPEPRRA